MAAAVLLVACSGGDQESSVIELSLDQSMALFVKGGDDQLKIPSVMVFDQNGDCIAKASNRDIYSVAFRKSISEQVPSCSEYSLAEFQENIPIRPEPSDTYTFVILAEDGDACDACSGILTEFEDQVLSGLNEPYSSHTIHIGMGEWFSLE